jgi:hypothetical protein
MNRPLQVLPLAFGPLRANRALAAGPATRAVWLSDPARKAPWPPARPARLQWTAVAGGRRAELPLAQEQ